MLFVINSIIVTSGTYSVIYRPVCYCVFQPQPIANVMSLNFTKGSYQVKKKCKNQRKLGEVGGWDFFFVYFFVHVLKKITYSVALS